MSAVSAAEVMASVWAKALRNRRARVAALLVRPTPKRPMPASAPVFLLDDIRHRLIEFFLWHFEAATCGTKDLHPVCLLIKKAIIRYFSAVRTGCLS